MSAAACNPGVWGCASAGRLFVGGRRTPQLAPPESCDPQTFAHVFLGKGSLFVLLCRRDRHSRKSRRAGRRQSSRRARWVPQGPAVWLRATSKYRSRGSQSADSNELSQRFRTAAESAATKRTGTPVALIAVDRITPHA